MRQQTLFQRVAEAAARAPGKVAVSGCGGALDYRALIAGARGIAAALLDAGVAPGDRVAVWMEKSPATVQALLGILAAGAAYVALDPKSPVRRCQLICQDSGAVALVTDQAHAPQVPALLSGGRCRLVLVEGTARPKAGPFVRVRPLSEARALPASPLPDVSPEGLAYVLYTSGSTGAPKGVMHTHASGLAFVDWVLRTFDVSAADVFSSHAPFHFDLSISDLYAALSAGASVRLIGSVEAMSAPWLARKITEWGITVWYSVPSVLIAMLDQGRLEQLGMPTVRTLFFAGEVFPIAQLQRLRRAVPHADLCNLYGPTETNVCTWYRVPATLPDDAKAIPIGPVCDHLEGFALDDEGREADEGTLWIKGPNLLAGYWGDPEKTGATLRMDPRGRPGLAYCTGDLVRRRADGGYDYFGRRDHQIKCRGFRIELGEIESVVAGHPNVLEAVAWAVPDPKAGHRIVVTVIPRSGGPLERNELHNVCVERLPNYMVPEQFEIRAELPRTSTGKVDRNRLRADWEARERPW